MGNFFGGSEIQLADELTGFAGAEFTVHIRILELDTERALVTCLVQRPDDRFEIDPAAARGAEVPVAARITEGQMPAEDTGLRRGGGPVGILHVDVIDAVAERADESNIVHALITQMTGIIVEAKFPAPAKGLEGFLGSHDIESNFGGMDFQCKPNAFPPKDIQDGFHMSAKNR